MLKNILRATSMTVLLATAVGCGSKSDNNNNNTNTTGDNTNTTSDCFKGTPTKHEDFINACVPDTVTKIDKKSTIAAGKANLPALP